MRHYRFVDTAVSSVGEREFRGNASSPDLQSDGWALELLGGDLSRFQGRGGPLILEHTPENLLGTVWMEATADKLPFRAEFVPEGVSALADQTCRMLKAGAPYGLSIGFMPDEWEWINPSDANQGRRVTRWTCLELSLVSVPMDSKAIITARGQIPLVKLTPREQYEVERTRTMRAWSDAQQRERDLRRARLERLKSTVQ